MCTCCAARRALAGLAGCSTVASTCAASAASLLSAVPQLTVSPVPQEGEAQVLHVQCKPLAYFTRARDFVVLRVWTMVSGREGVVLSRSVEHAACPPDPEVRYSAAHAPSSGSSLSGVV